MADYTVHKTDISEQPIDVQEKRVDTSSLDVALFGKIRLEYGERLNEDLLNILENFACGEKTSVTPIVPDLDQTSNSQLSNPTIGQFWYNSTRQQIYFWNGTEWSGVPTRESSAANWGQIMHGEQLPRPVSPITGYVFPYEECIWTIAPSVFVGKIGYVACATDAQARVTMQYRLGGTNDVLDGLANYLIIGLKGTATSTGPFPTPPAPSPTPSVTPTMTPTPSSTVTPTPTMTMTVTATPTPTVTSTVTPTVTSTITPTPAVSPSSSVTPTPTPVPSNTPTPSPFDITQIIVGGGSYYASTQVVTGATAGAGIGLLLNGTVGKSGSQTGGPSRWLAPGFNAADFEVSFSGNFFAQFPGDSWYSTPAGNNTMGPPGAWYNMANGVGWSAGTTRDICNLNIGFTIRQISTGRTVDGDISCSNIAGIPI